MPKPGKTPSGFPEGKVSFCGRRSSFNARARAFHLAGRIKDGQTKPSILLADDDGLFREGLRRHLEPEFSIAASVGDGEALVEAVQALTPDLIITDISMPLLSGFQAARRWKSLQPGARVIFLTVHEDPVFVAEAERIGALGYVLKRCVPSDLIPAIREVLEGRPFVSPAALE